MSAMAMLKRGDTRTAIRATLKDAAGAPVNLAGATARFIMADLRGPVINRSAIVHNEAAGVVWFVFEPLETAVAGIYRAEFEVTFGDGRKETYPNDDYITVNILPDLG